MMCLGIPGLVLELPSDESQYAWADVSGARRRVNIALLSDEGVRVGDWVLVHVGFALARLNEAEARSTLDMLEGMETAYRDELAAMAASAHAAPPGTAGPGTGPSS